MKTLFVLIGPPAVGKTTWVQENAPDATVVNRDDIVEATAAKHGLSYDEAFVAPPQDAVIGSIVAGQEKFGSVITSDLSWRELDFSLPQTIHREASEKLAATLAVLALGDRDVVLDMTSMNVANRALYIQHFGDDFHKVAVLFDFQEESSIAAIKQRAARRQEELKKQGRSKSISPEVIDRMISSYEPPSSNEGFAEIVAYDILSIQLANPKWGKG